MPTPKLVDLPLEILNYTLSFLNYADIHDARLVCKKMYAASLDTNIIDRERVDFDADYSNLQPKDLLESKRDFLHFKFLNQSSLTCDATVWSHFGPKLKSLEFFHCAITEDQLFAVLNHCNRLKYLTFCLGHVKISKKTAAESYDNYDKLTFDNDSSLQLNLEGLQVSQQMDPRLFWKILKCSPNLNSLLVAGFQGERFQCRIDRKTKTPYLPLTLDDIFIYLKIRGSKLLDLELNIDNHWVDVSGMLTNALSQTNNLRLRKIFTNVEVSKEFLVTQKHCQKLELRDASLEMVDFACRELQNLTHLALTSSFRSSHDVKHIQTLKNLYSLYISVLREPTFICTDVFTGLCGDVNTTLRILELHYTSKNVLVSPECIIGLAKTYPALRQLVLLACDGVTDGSVQSIFRHMRSLETLKLSECHNLTDAGLKGFSLASSHNDDTNNQTVYRYSIARLTKLKTLDLSGCGQITGGAFTGELKFPELRFISLRNPQISCSTLIPFIESNRTIEQLCLDDCDEFTDEFVSVVLKKLWRLRHIRAGVSSGISVENTQLLKSQCKRVYNLPATEKRQCKRVHKRLATDSSSCPKTNLLMSLFRRLFRRKTS